MKISLECGNRMRYEEFKQALAACNPPYTFVGMDPKNPISLIFEVDMDDIDKAVMIAEMTCKKTRYGKITSLRVTPYGKLVYYKPKPGK